MTIDRLDALLSRFSLNARLFFSGALCGVHDFDEGRGVGFIHVVQRGPVEVHHAPASRVGVLKVVQPSLLFYPRPLGHRFITDARDGADMVCASLSYNAGLVNPIANALPPIMAVPLAELPELKPVIDLLFGEAFTTNCGRQSVLDRLFEVLIIHLLRKAMNDSLVDSGLLAGLAHPQLAQALVALHEKPAENWSLESLADKAGMSRSVFANTFRDVVGMTPGDYLTCWRITLAQDLLRRGRALKHVAVDVGYGSAEALSRAFKARTGQTTREYTRDPI
ncbi:MAG: AraC family transcriptional regulator [Betaproteobacteria bacterium]|nr:AraC family transcriptional regulator [Betaproteobacteria bacterium]